MAGSTFAAVKGKIIASLKADSRLSDVQIEYGVVADLDAKDAIYFGETTSDNEIVHMRSGRKRGEEKYILNLFVEIVRDAADAQECDARSSEVFTIIEELLRDDPTLGIAGASATDDDPKIIQAILRNWRHVALPTDIGYTSQIHARIEVSATLL